MKKSISVVIPNYNGTALLKENLPSVYQALNTAGVDYEVIVSDDASTDESIQFLKQEFPEILIIENPINRGFAPTINDGFKKASKDLVLMLNSDVKLTRDYFLSLLKYFEKSETFGVTGKVLGLQDQIQQDGAKYPKLLASGLRSTINYKIEEVSPDFWHPTFFMSGSNALVDRNKLNELQGFDEAFAPFYGEDVELGIRAHRLGWKCYYEQEAICFHPVSATIASYHKQRFVRMISTCNRLYLNTLHLHGKDLFVFWLLYSLKLLFGWLSLKLAYYYKPYFLFLKKRKEMKFARKRLRELFRKYSKHSLRQVIGSIEKELANYKTTYF